MIKRKYLIRSSSKNYLERFILKIRKKLNENEDKINTKNWG